MKIENIVLHWLQVILSSQIKYWYQ